MKFLLTNIIWDKKVDGQIQQVDLPLNVEIEAKDIDMAIDLVSDLFGYCILVTSIYEK